MTWQTVPICYGHWMIEEGDRRPVRTRNIPTEPCYRCGEPSNIYVRRDVNENNDQARMGDGDGAPAEAPQAQAAFAPPAPGESAVSPPGGPDYPHGEAIAHGLYALPGRCFAWQMWNPQGHQWQLIGAMMPNGDKMPLVSSSNLTIAQLEPIAREHGRLMGCPVRLVGWMQGNVMDVFDPPSEDGGDAVPGRPDEAGPNQGD